MNTFAKTDDSKALKNQSRDMSAGENSYLRPVNRRWAKYPEQSSFPKAFGQRPNYQSGKPTITPSAYNANRSTGRTNGKVVNYYLLKDNEVKLQTCENAWVPQCLKRKIACGSPDDNSTEEIRKKFMSILNKISPENMTMLAESITSLPIDTDNQLKIVIDLLFQKAIVEPSFTPQYAYICTVLNDKKMKSENKTTKTSFKKLLIKCCKDEFEVMHVHEQNLAKSLEEINLCNDQEVKNQLQSAYDQDEMVHRKKSVGNCRFMCELYKVQILSNGTLEACINHLLKSPNEETLECACNILKHAGNTLNTKVAFGKLKEYASSVYKTKISTRIRFMILDIIELKENNWVPRNVRTKPALCPNRVLTNVQKPEYRPSTYIQYKPAILPMSNYPSKIKPLTEIQKDDERANRIGFNDSSSAICVSDVIKGKKSSVLPCITSETSNTNSYKTLENENTRVQEVREKCRMILENITTENMISSAKSITLLPIKTDACLTSIVEVLFQKALDEPSLILQYVHVCSTMKNKEIKSGDNKKPNTSFRKLLVNMCQDVFESMFTRKRIAAKERIEIESCKNKKTKKELQLQFDKNETVHRKRSVANCRFICELLKVNILIPPILEMCLAKLINSPKELSLECVCVILQHVGSTVNHNGVLEKLQEYSTAPKAKFSTGVRSMILDTLELMNPKILQATCNKPLLTDETKVVTLFVEPSVERIELPSSDLSVAQNSVCPEVFNSGKLEVYNTVKTIISSITVNNKNTSINELSVHLKNIDVMDRTINFLFERAKMYPKTIPQLVSVCSSLRDVPTSGVVEGRHIKPSSLKKRIAIRCNKLLLSEVQNGPSENDFTSEQSQSYTFIGELFNENVLSPHILEEFLKILPDKLSNKTLENVCDLLKVAGKKIEEVYSLKKTLRRLTNRLSNDAEGIFSHRSDVLLKALVELRDKKWVS